MIVQFDRKMMVVGLSLTFCSRSHMSMVANNALLGVGVRVWIREQKKSQKKSQGTTKPLMANLDIPLVGCLYLSQLLEDVLTKPL